MTTQKRATLNVTRPERHSRPEPQQLKEAIREAIGQVIAVTPPEADALCRALCSAFRRLERRRALPAGAGR